MKVVELAIPGVIRIEPSIFTDNRGHFLETYHAERYPDQGLQSGFVQDNLSLSRRNVLRGMHYQLGHPQSKLVMAVQGEIFDVAVDVRRGSPTFGKWVAAVLSSENRHQLFIPEGFAHGFCVLSDTATVSYKCSDFYTPKEERGLRWNDPAMAIAWPVADPVLSEKDGLYPTLDTIAPADLPQFAGGNA